jgi:hypothetical protein
LATLTSGLVATGTPWAIKTVALANRNKANASLDIPKLDDIANLHSLFTVVLSPKNRNEGKTKQKDGHKTLTLMTPPGQSWMAGAQNKPAATSIVRNRIVRDNKNLWPI